MRPRLRNGCLCNDFRSKDFLSLHILHFIALGEAALAQESAFGVSARHTILSPHTSSILDNFHTVQVAM
jgi:hypothetical protein